MGRVALWLAGLCACMAIAACSRETSNPAPPRLVTPLTLSDQASTIRLPIGIPLRDLEQLLNREVPTLLHRIDEPQQTCIETKSKLLPDISCRLVGKVERGRIRLSGSGRVLNLTMPVRTTVSAERIGKIIRRETANGAVQVRARVELDLLPNWHPVARIRADYAWTNRIGIDFLGQRITFASKVDPKIRAVLVGLERSLPAHLEKLEARQKIEQVWAKGFTSVRVKSDPQIWVRFTPQQVGFSGYKVEKDQLVIDFSARAKTETLFGDRPADQPATPLPDLMAALPPGGINVHVPMLVHYGVLEDVARRALVSDRYKTVTLKGGATVDAQVHDVTIYGAEGNRLAVGLDVSLKTRSGALSTKGRVWFVARPVVDVGAKVVGLRSLDIAGQTDSRAFQLLVEAVNLSAIPQLMLKSIRYDFGEDYADGLRKADEWLAAEPFEGFVFKGDLGTAHIRNVRIAPDGVLIEADATGTGAMTYAPREAANLVAQRRARRVEREKAAMAEKTGAGGGF